MSEKAQDYCPDDTPCTDCQSRRGFVSKFTKLGAGALIAAAGILGMDRKFEGLLGPKLRAPDAFEIKAFLGAKPEDMPEGEFRDAVIRQDETWIKERVRLENKPGQAGAICSGCAWVLYTRYKALNCSSGPYSCWNHYCCYVLNGGSCYFSCSGPSNPIHCGSC